MSTTTSLSKHRAALKRTVAFCFAVPSTAMVDSKIRRLARANATGGMRPEIGDPNNSVHDLDAQDLGPVSALLLRTNACVPCSIEVRGVRDF